MGQTKRFKLAFVTLGFFRNLVKKWLQGGSSSGNLTDAILLTQLRRKLEAGAWDITKWMVYFIENG